MLGVAFGAVALVQALSFGQLVGLAVWLGGAVVLHDGVLVPLMILLSRLLTRMGRALPAGALLLIEGGFVVGSLLTLVVAPELYAQSLGPRNPTILDGDYSARLLGVWAAIAVVVAGGVAMLIGWQRVGARRTSSRRTVSK
jgi:hypothetical protein